MNGLAAGFSVKVFFGGALGTSAAPAAPPPVELSRVEDEFAVELMTAELVLLLVDVFMTEDATCGGEVELGCWFCCCCWGGG